ncbi:hypothetical protein HXX76_007403 [Chlamydomonas incerta]|uniref:GRAM domain-containing protein n=1 Tax=Chlamydomonas incerta TaxID=51695 RepID=A0A835W354_CHLIN|nr:hypothetical protein HXX76_007403 [Chlamydomonas incerta]|eukprot:KAG2435329.1 hypothetical protein HXX76_007403 [Chlamydomonas incerta]
MAGTEPESAGEASGLGEEEVEYEEVEEEVEYEEGEEEEEEQEQKEAEDAAGDDSKPKESDDSKAPEVAQPEAGKSADKEDAASEEVPPPASQSARDAEASPDADEKPAAAASSPPSELVAVSESAAAPSGSGAGGDLDFKNLEVQAAKVAQAAKDMSSKLTAGLRSAFGGAETATAGASLSKLAGGLTSWWGSLDPAPQPVRDETAERVASSNKASSELQQLFGLGAEENLVEHFKCKLLQTYACSHNSHTPAIQMAFQGTLYVTDRHTCFSVEERGRKLPFKVPHSAVVKATRQRPARKGDLSDLLKMELGNGQWLAFKDFENGSALDSALALVEHLMEGN